MPRKICNIEVKRENGRIVPNIPQDRYKNPNNLSLHRYGAGKFCYFKIQNNQNFCGVYLIKVNGVIKYIGECKNLSKRFNMGYGQISPRNCFVGGQQTNCRINKKILEASKKKNKIELWFKRTNNYMVEERNLIQHHMPEWNIK